MKKHIKVLGIGLISLGLLVIVVDFLAGWSHINSLRLSAVGFIMAGAVVYTLSVKKDSKY